MNGVVIAGADMSSAVILSAVPRGRRPTSQSRRFHLLRIEDGDGIALLVADIAL
jgi:hypothetical protein